MKILDLVQGSRAWHDFRSCHIGASDSSTIMGMNPWENISSLWEEKVLGWEKPHTDAMTRGQSMETMARESYQILTGLSVLPLVCEDDKIPYMSASFDGITHDLTRAVEIKCGIKSHKSAKSGAIPAYYVCQLQHQMKIAELDEIDYYSFDGKDGILIVQKRDNEFIKEMLERYSEFWNYVITKTPPRQYHETTFII